MDTEQGRQTGEITVFVYESPYPWILQFLWGEQTDGASGSEEQAEELERSGTDRAQRRMAPGRCSVSGTAAGR